LASYNISVSPSHDPAIEGLAKLLAPLTDCFTAEVAERVISLEADEQVEAGIAELAEKANEGQLTDSQAAEYDACIQAMGMLSVIQARATTIVKDSGG
jgi:hypothetical protein